MSSRPPSLHSIIDQTSLKSDFMYKQQLRQCLGVELAKVMKHESSCLSLNISEIRILLATFIEALLDVDTLDAFPTSNYKLMLKMGGIESEVKEKRRVHQLSHSNHQYTTEFPGIENVDNEAKGLYQIRDDFLKSPGRFMAARLWSFGDNLGIVLKKWCRKNPTNSNYNSLLGIAGALLKDDSDLEPGVRDVCMDVLGSLPLLSIEGQCIKRFMKLRAIYRTLLHSGPSEGEKKQLTDALLSSIIKAIIQQLDTIATCINYHEKNKLENHTYAKACALQNAFSHLAIATASWLIKEISVTSPESNNFGSFLFSSLLLPSLKSGTIDLGKALRPNSLIKFDFQPSIGNAITYQSSFDAINNHVRELVIHAACTDINKQSTLFDSILECSLSNANGLAINFLPAMVSEEFECKDVEDLSCFAKALHLYYSLSSTSSTRSGEKEDRAIIKFRSYAVRKFISRKLWLKDKKKKIIILNHLEKILNTRSLQRQCGKGANFLLTNSNSDNKGYLNFCQDICPTVYGLSHCLESTIGYEKFDDLLIKKIFRCFHHILSFTMSEGNNNVFKWCQSRMNHDEHAKYFVLEMNFIFHLSEIIVNPPELIPDFLWIFNEEMIEEADHLPKQVKDCKSLHMEKQLVEETLFPVKSNKRNHLTPDNKYMQKGTKSMPRSADRSIVDLNKDSVAHVKEFIVAYKKQL